MRKQKPKRGEVLLLCGLAGLLCIGCGMAAQDETVRNDMQTIVTRPTETMTLPALEQSIPTQPLPTETTSPATETTTEAVTEAPTEAATEPATEAPTEAPTEEVTQPPHVHSYTTKVKAPTCTEGGYTVYTCSCGDSYRGNETPATEHQDTETVVPPKIGKEGYTKHLCACGKQYWDNYTTFSDEEMAAIEAELAELIRKELNRLRAEQGAGPLENQVGMSQVAQYRSRQLKNHYGHHTFDIREAHAAYQYGRYVDMTEYGYPESYNYYTSNSPEAIGWIGIIEELQAQAEHVANAFFKSEDHWSYLGDGENIYCGIGCTATYSHWMICIMVNSVTYG